MNNAVIHGSATQHKRKGPPRQDISVRTRRCTKCGDEKPVSEFDKRTAKYSDGTTATVPISSCRKCRNEQFRAVENVRMKARHKKDRMLALRHYAGDGPIVCGCCGEPMIEFLTLDHIDESGAQHRREHPGASNLATWLRSRGFPDGFQVLCLNCNLAKHRFGECPHQANKRWPGVTVKAGAIVAASAAIGTRTIVWPYASIGEDAVLGSDVVIGAQCYVGRGSIIGSGVRLQTGVFLPNNSVIEDDAFLGPHVVCTDDKYPRSGNKSYVAQPPVIRRGASIGAGAVLLPGVVVGEYAMVAAGAVVTKDVYPGETVAGVPAFQLRKVA